MFLLVELYADVLRKLVPYSMLITKTMDLWNLFKKIYRDYVAYIDLHAMRFMSSHPKILLFLHYFVFASNDGKCFHPKVCQKQGAASPTGFSWMMQKIH